MNDVLGWVGFLLIAFVILLGIDAIRELARAVYRRWLAPREDDDDQRVS